MLTLILSPLCTQLERKGLRPSAASAICVLGLILLIVLGLSAFIPYLFASTMDLTRRILPTLTTLTQQATVLLHSFGIHLSTAFNPAESLGALLSWGTNTLAKGSVAFAARAGQIAFSLVIAYYLLCERKLIGRHLLLLLPISWRMAFLSACLGCKNALMSYLSGGGYILPPSESMGGTDEVRVLIGPENVAEELKDSSVVIASYDAGDNTRGLIGVVGPTRMDYSAVAAKLSFLAAGLSKRLGGGEAPPEGMHNKLIIKGDDPNGR